MCVIVPLMIFKDSISYGGWSIGVIGLALFVILGFLQNGFQIDNGGKLYKGIRIFKYRLYKKEIDLDLFNKVTLLKTNKSTTDEDSGSKTYFKMFEVALLNEKHTEKNIILSEF